MKCLCQSGQDYNRCCEPYIEGSRHPLTALALMRSRYSAYATGHIKYIKDTLAPEARKDFDEEEARAWASKSKWLGLKIISSKDGEEGDAKGTVEFSAQYQGPDGKIVEHHEVSQFRKDPSSGRWYFVDGEAHTHAEGEGHGVPQTPVKRESPKVGRNDPCPCGSGKKFKKCCGD